VARAFGRYPVVRTIALLELSPAAYEEIERQLLDAGYFHVFEAGPGSQIDLSGIGVVRESEEVRYAGV
jgi:hypothetical protein